MYAHGNVAMKCRPAICAAKIKEDGKEKQVTVSMKFRPAICADDKLMRKVEREMWSQ